MKPRGPHPRGVHPEGSSPPRAHPGEVQPVPPALEGPQRGSGQPPAPAQAKLPRRLPAWVPPTAGEAKFLRGRAAPGDQMQMYSGPPTRPCPKVLWPVWEAGRRQEPVPGEMSLAPGGGGGRGGGSGLLQAALNDSWPRREDWQGREFIVAGKGEGGKKRGGCRLAATVAMGREGGERTQLSPRSERRGPDRHP